MPDELDFASLVNDASGRRLWLLRKAMESAPLDRAIDVARMAEAFIVGSGHRPPLAARAVIEAAKPPQPIDATIRKSSIEPRSAEPRRGLVLSAEQRDRLLDRLANGARNAGLATEFGLAPRQVQGIRMGSAKEIAERREALPNGTPLESDHSHDQPKPNGTPLPSDHAHEQATADDIVRYLRQQDDIVVPQGEGAFLVNGRFRLELPELVVRANKMRSRHGKPEFRVARELPDQKRVRQATRHPIFWEQESGSKQASARAN